MKNLRQIFVSSALTLAAFSAVLYSGCSKSKCGSVVCQNSGVCSSNKCSCGTGYSGDACQNAWSTQYLGLYSCTQTCKPSANGGTWQSNVTTASTDGGYTITISNFANAISSIDATVDSSNHVTISTSSGSTNIQGSGLYTVVNGKTIITLTYSSELNNGQESSTCTMVMTKQ